MASAKRLLWGLGAVGVVVILGSSAAGADGLTGRYRQVSPDDVPAVLRGPVRALGDRLWKPGKERVVLNGVLSSGAGDIPAQLAMELPGLGRLDLKGSAGSKSVVFDGSSASASNGMPDNTDEDMLETLLDDSPESLFLDVAQGANLWLAGQRYRMEDANAPGGVRWLDVYGSVRPVKQRKEDPVRRKMYCFDSTTLLLHKVVYRPAPDGPLVETTIDGWENVDGEAVPTGWTRKVNGKAVFSFRRLTTVVSAGAGDGLFSPGN